MSASCAKSAHGIIGSSTRSGSIISNNVAAGGTHRRISVSGIGQRISIMWRSICHQRRHPAWRRKHQRHQHRHRQSAASAASTRSSEGVGRRRRRGRQQSRLAASISVAINNQRRRHRRAVAAAVSAAGGSGSVSVSGVSIRGYRNGGGSISAVTSWRDAGWHRRGSSAWRTRVADQRSKISISITAAWRRNSGGS